MLGQNSEDDSTGSGVLSMVTVLSVPWLCPLGALHGQLSSVLFPRWTLESRLFLGAAFTPRLFSCDKFEDLRIVSGIGLS